MAKVEVWNPKKVWVKVGLQVQKWGVKAGKKVGLNGDSVLTPILLPVLFCPPTFLSMSGQEPYFCHIEFFGVWGSVVVDRPAQVWRHKTCILKGYGDILGNNLGCPKRRS